jgi:hypothetical protein
VAGQPGSGPRAGGVQSGIVAGPIFLESDDLYKEFEGLRSRGVTFADPAEPMPYAFGVRLTALDPDGNRIELRQRPQRQSSES